MVDVLFEFFKVIKKTDEINEILNSNYPELKDYKTSLFYGENLNFLKKLIDLEIMKIDYKKEEIAIANTFMDEFKYFTDYLIKNEPFDISQDLKTLLKNNKK